MTKEKLLERCDDNYEIKSGVDIVVFQAAIEAMQLFADQETATLRAENERLNKTLSSSIQTGEKAIEKIGELEKDNERLRGLIEKAHSEGYEDAVHHIEYAKSLKQFKTENNL